MIYFLTFQFINFSDEKVVNGERRYLCTQCGLLFNRKFNLKRHYVAKHTTEFKKSKKRLIQNSKGTLISTNFKMKKNLGSVKEKDAKKSFYCVVCNDKFSRRFNLQRHIKAVHPESHINKKQRVTHI